MHDFVPALEAAPNLVAAVVTMPMVGVSGSAVGNWLADNIVFVLVVIVGIIILTAAITKKPRDAALAAGICMLGLAVVSIGAYWRELGDWMRVTFFGG